MKRSSPQRAILPLFLARLGVPAPALASIVVVNLEPLHCSGYSARKLLPSHSRCSPDGDGLKDLMQLGIMC